VSELVSNMTREQANQLLDLVRAGGVVPQSDVLFALWVTGDLFHTEAAAQ